MADDTTTEMPQRIATSVYVVRGQRVMLEEDLAGLYGLPTKALNQAVRRNPDRFPEDFMFQLADTETDRLRSQFVTSNGRGGRRYQPLAFTVATEKKLACQAWKSVGSPALISR